MYKGKYYRPKAVPQAPVSENVTENTAENPPKTAKPKRKLFRKPRLSTIIFYSFYVLLIVAFFIGMRKITVPLKDWLVRYEASQPEKKCEEVFEALFADPDWEHLYGLAGIEDTTYDGSQSCRQGDHLCGNLRRSFR